MSLPVSVILRRKGAEVFTIGPNATVAAAARELAAHGIGALVVSSDGQAVEGMLSERDVVRTLAEKGADGLETPVAQIMTSDVLTCTLDTSIDELSATMTERRIRHIPILDGERLAGIISIGDVVKSRLDALEVQARAMEQYVTGSA